MGFCLTFMDFLWYLCFLLLLLIGFFLPGPWTDASYMDSLPEIYGLYDPYIGFLADSMYYAVHISPSEGRCVRVFENFES